MAKSGIIEIILAVVGIGVLIYVLNKMGISSFSQLGTILGIKTDSAGNTSQSSVPSGSAVPTDNYATAIQLQKTTGLVVSSTGVHTAPKYTGSSSSSPVVGKSYGGFGVTFLGYNSAGGKVFK